MLIQVENVKKSYGTVQVLKGVSFQVEEKEVVSIVGPSGAGKSTLLHIIGTIDKADEGSILLDRQDISTLSNEKLNKLRQDTIGFVFQHHHLLPEFTALENVIIPALIRKEARKYAEERAREILSYLGLENRLTHKPSELSGGELQRVAVARALINNPRIILADEPSGNLDSKNAEELHRLFFRLRDHYGQTFLIVTHNRELAAMSDRTLMLKDGLIQN